MKVYGEILPGVQYVERPGAYALIQNPAGLYAIVRTPNGLFLPGGGIDPGEDPVLALRRELQEEIGFRLLTADLVNQAVQYHWSAHYRQYFKKIGRFYRCAATPPQTPQGQADHELLWLSVDYAARSLTQEFQRAQFPARELTSDS